MERTLDDEKRIPAVVVNGSGHEETQGPPIGVVDIGESNKAYICLVSVPGLQLKKKDLSFDIKRDGTVTVRGVDKVHELLKDSSSKYKMTVRELNPPGRFTISFCLPGPVDTRVMLPQLRADGILEVVVYKLGCSPSV